jgi:hypothetical protein
MEDRFAVEECKQQAQACITMAERAANSSDRVRWLRMAQFWKGRIREQELRRPERLSA